MENKKDLKDRTKNFALRIIKMYASLPASTEAEIMGQHVLRCGTLVGASYREASRGRPRTEFVAKMGDCLREIGETTYWLELLHEGNVLPKNKLSGLLQESHELTAIFNAIIKKAGTDGRKK